jgi:hypothetical protein
MGDLFNTLPWFAVVLCVVVTNSLNNDKIALQTANERLLNDKTKIELINQNLKEQSVICASELKGYSNGSK